MKRLVVLFCFFISCAAFSQNEALERLRNDLTLQNQDTTKVNTTLKIINILYDTAEYKKALQNIVVAEKLSQNLNYKKGTAALAYYKALIYNKQDDYTNAASQFDKATQLYTNLKDTLSLLKVKYQLGVLEIERGNYKTGLILANEGINELEKRGVNNDLANAYQSLGEAYKNTGVTEKAIDYNLKCIEVLERINNLEGLLKANVSLGELYYENKDFKKTIYYYQKVLDDIKYSNNKLRASILPNLGSAYIKTGDLKTAENYLIEAIKLNKNTENEKATLKSLNSLGALNIKKQHYKTAENYLLEAGHLSRKNNEKLELLINYKLMKTLDSTKGNFESAFAWQREYFKIKTQFDTERTEYNTPSLQKGLVSNTTKDSIVALSNNAIKTIENNTSSKEKLDRLKLNFYAVLAAFAVVLVLFILFYLKRNNGEKYTRDLEAKNEKIELQNEAILEQSKHLESVNNVKDKLFSIVSHDLKDSLTSTKGFIDLLKDGQLSQEEFHSLLPELSENANNASLLLFNLLNWSKSQMQSLKPKPSLFDIQEVFYEKVKLVEQKMQTKGVTLIDNTLRDFVYADISMVEIIIQNLLANAVKFCKKGDTVTIFNAVIDDKSIISIADSGVGISVENQSKLFDNNTFSTIGTENEKGTGLGLTICKELVELNLGRLWVESELNVGSTFFVELSKNRVENTVVN